MTVTVLIGKIIWVRPVINSIVIHTIVINTQLLTRIHQHNIFNISWFYNLNSLPTGSDLGNGRPNFKQSWAWRAVGTITRIHYAQLASYLRNLSSDFKTSSSWIWICELTWINFKSEISLQVSCNRKTARFSASPALHKQLVHLTMTGCTWTQCESAHRPNSTIKEESESLVTAAAAVAFFPFIPIKEMQKSFVDGTPCHKNWTGFQVS